MKIISSIVRSRLKQPEIAPVIDVAGRAVPVRVQRHALAKGYKLRIDRDGAARLTMPARGSERRAVDWAKTQAAWIADQIDRLDSGGRRLEDGVVFPLEGVPVTIVWRVDLPRRIGLEGDRLLVGGPPELAGERVQRWLKARARAVLADETHRLAARHGLRLISVGIGDPTSRWGSCSASGAIRYSWRLILAPPEVRRATVAHEVAHLKHLDHSASFHAFHRAICESDTVAARAWLRANGAGLHRMRV